LTDFLLFYIIKNSTLVNKTRKSSEFPVKWRIKRKEGVMKKLCSLSLAVFVCLSAFWWFSNKASAQEKPVFYVKTVLPLSHGSELNEVYLEKMEAQRAVQKAEIWRKILAERAKIARILPKLTDREDSQAAMNYMRSVECLEAEPGSIDDLYQEYRRIKGEEMVVRVKGDYEPGQILSALPEEASVGGNGGSDRAKDEKQR